MTTELRSVYSGPIRRALEGLDRRMAAYEAELAALHQENVTLRAQVHELEARDAG